MHMSSDTTPPSSGQLRFGRSHEWGLIELKIDEPSLSLGKLAVTAARGLLMDGTPFDMPGWQPLPPPLPIPEGTHTQEVYLASAAMPSPKREQDEAGVEADRGRLPAEFTLSLESNDWRGRRALPLARVAEQRAGRVSLDASYVPPCLDCRASAKILDDIDQITGLLVARSES